MHKIAIIKLVESPCYDDYIEQEMVVSSITEWEEVSDETFVVLTNAARSARINNWNTQFAVVEQLLVNSEQVIHSVSQYIDMVAKNEKKAAEAKAAKLAAAEKRRLDKLAKTEAGRRALYEQLQAEFSPETTK